jgi:hypothetical protein
MPAWHEKHKFFSISSDTTHVLTNLGAEALQHEREFSNTGRSKLDFAEIDKCKPVLLRLSLAGNLENT